MRGSIGVNGTTVSQHAHGMLEAHFRDVKHADVETLFPKIEVGIRGLDGVRSVDGDVYVSAEHEVLDSEIVTSNGLSVRSGEMAGLCHSIGEEPRTWLEVDLRHSDGVGKAMYVRK